MLVLSAVGFAYLQLKDFSRLAGDLGLLTYSNGPDPDYLSFGSNDKHFSTYAVRDSLGSQEFAELFSLAQAKRNKSVTGLPKANDQRQFNLLQIKPLNRISFTRYELLKTGVCGLDNFCLYEISAESRLSRNFQSDRLVDLNIEAVRRAKAHPTIPGKNQIPVFTLNYKSTRQTNFSAGDILACQL